jgi:hypothetical protein
MINWYNLFANSLRILALSLILAVLSYTRWEATQWRERLKDRLKLPQRSILLNLAGAPFCLGLAATSHFWWEIALWLLLFIFFLIQVWGLWQTLKQI